MKDITKIVIENQKGVFIRQSRDSSRFYIDNKVVDGGYVKYLGKKWNVYTVLARHAHNEAQGCILSYETLMHESGISKRNGISSALKTLEALNMLVRKKVTGTKSRLYYLTDRSQWKSTTSIHVDTDKSVSKLQSKRYPKTLNISIHGGTQNELKKETKEMNENKSRIPEPIRREMEELLKRIKMPNAE